MAAKGESKGQKALSVTKARDINRKENVWTISSKPGPHSKKSSVPLGFVVRNMLGLSTNIKETKHILNNAMIKVNGLVRKDYRFSIGLFDVVEIEAKKKKYRILFDSLGRLKLTEIDFKGDRTRLFKVLNKKTVKGRKTKIKLDDGSLLDEEKNKLKVGDSIKLSLPERKFIASYAMKAGALVYIIGGTHVASTAEITSISPGTRMRPKLINLKQNEEEFQTIERNVFVVGDKKPEIELGGKS